MEDKIYKRLEKKMAEITVVAPQDVGVFTPVYKAAAPFLKFAPWRVLVPLSFFFSILVYLVVGSLVVFLVSYLQYGF